MTVQEKLGIKYRDEKWDFPVVVQRQSIKLYQMVQVDAEVYKARPAIQWGKVVYIRDGDVTP